MTARAQHFKSQGIHTLADAQRSVDAAAKRLKRPTVELKQVPHHLRGAASPLLGFAVGDCRGFWRGKLWDPKAERGER
jgi:hypothetical protein